MQRSQIKSAIKTKLPYLPMAKNAVQRIVPGLSYPFGSFVSATNSLRRQMRMGSYPIVLDYPVQPEPRYGWGKPPHDLLYGIIDANREQYLQLIDQFTQFSSKFHDIPAVAPEDSTVPDWGNTWLQGLDAVSLYALPAILQSSLYIEIGSGYSTKFVRRSITDNSLKTKIISIDPHPRAEIDRLCDTSVRQPLESVDLDVFSQLGRDDILMFDGSHRCLQNSDVQVFFLEVLPRLSPGVVVFVHDIFLPYDYRPEWGYRWYSEQYLLATLLLNDAGNRYDVIFPGLFVDKDDELRASAEQFWTKVDRPEPLPNGATGFWMRVRDPKPTATTDE